MKKAMVLIAIVLFGFSGTSAADILDDGELAAIYAGEDTAINDDIVAESSAVANQKNIAVIGSTNSSVSNSNIGNYNSANVSNLGDSAVAIQTNIAAVSGLGTAQPTDNNTIINDNQAGVTNTVAAGGSVDGISDGSTQSGAGSNSAFTSVSALQSAVASQNNIAAVVGGGSVSGTNISQTNSAIVSNNASGL